MCTVLLPTGDNPIAVNKYISYHREEWASAIKETKAVTGLYSQVGNLDLWPSKCKLFHSWHSSISIFISAAVP
jgi:hypothetical protein